MKHTTQQKGFTLVEMLAVMIVFVVIGSFVTAILITSLRGNNKTNTITAVRQNGNYALSQMAKTVRNARYLVSPASCGTISAPTVTQTLQLKDPDGNVITYDCSSGTNITSNSANLLDTTAVSLASCKFTCGQDRLIDQPEIGISFSLKQVNASTQFADLTASASAIEFSTSVVLRNITF